MARPLICSVIVLLLFASFGKRTLSSKGDGDYITVSIRLRAVIKDSAENYFPFSVFSDHGLPCDHNGEQVVTSQVPKGFVFKNPLNIISLHVDSNYPDNNYLRTVILNDSVIGIYYHLRCPTKVLGRPGHPPPPLPPRATIKIQFQCNAWRWGELPVSEFKNQETSATKTVFQFEYPYLPKTSSYQIEKWEWDGTLSVFKNNQLFRQYPISDVYPSLQKVSSQIFGNKMLVVQYLE